MKITVSAQNDETVERKTVILNQHDFYLNTYTLKRMLTRMLSKRTKTSKTDGTCKNLFITVWCPVKTTYESLRILKLLLGLH